MNLEQSFRASIKNISKHGDTDIFPFPFETHLFHDNPDACVVILKTLHDKFEDSLAAYPPEIIVTLSQVGYTGFRWATLIEPFWNAYYLALVIQIGDQIEAERIPESKEQVYSYRFAWEDSKGKLFKDSTWRNYKQRCLSLSQDYDYVVVTDISDFYPRIYHHRIENALQRLPDPGENPKRIMKLLSMFSKNVSYGLPIGGPASRILAELSLASVDRLLSTHQKIFCRYADDFCLFCSSKAEAYKLLVYLSEKLFNEGLVLQKNKTRILSSEEYRESSKAFIAAFDETDILGNQPQDNETKLLNISIRFDPYSPTAEEDYENLKNAVKDINIIEILAKEVAKTAIETSVVKQAINAIKALDPVLQSGAIRMVLDPNNLDVLSPVFVSILRLTRSLYKEVDDSTRDFIDDTLLNLFKDKSPLISVELNLSYFIQVLGIRYTNAKEELLADLFERETRPLLKRLIIITMANWNCCYWLSDLKNRYIGLSSWERRAFILASYTLTDEGKHWRDHIKRTWTPMDTCIRDWFCLRMQNNNREIPL
jgi:Reverse transcriptase (RNA-dependent DNA polymerase)